MTIIDPPPVQIPNSLQTSPEQPYFQANADVLYQLWDALRKLGTSNSTLISSNSQIKCICFGIDGGGLVPAAGTRRYIPVPYSGKIQGWAISSDQVGSVQIDVGKGILGASIVQPGTKPKLVNAQTGTGSVADWYDTSITAGDNIEFYVDSISTITEFVLVLKVLAS